MDRSIVTIIQFKFKRYQFDWSSTKLNILNWKHSLWFHIGRLIHIYCLEILIIFSTSNSMCQCLKREIRVIVQQSSISGSHDYEWRWNITISKIAKDAYWNGKKVKEATAIHNSNFQIFTQLGEWMGCSETKCLIGPSFLEKSTLCEIYALNRMIFIYLLKRTVFKIINHLNIP